MKLAFLIFALLIIPSFDGFSQGDSIAIHNKQYTFLSINYHDGDVLPTNDFVSGLNVSSYPIDFYRSLSLKFGWQNPGYKDWQKIYRGPYYGGGLYIADFHNQDEMGYPNAAFGFLGIPLIRYEKFEIYTEMQFGMAWNWTHYDSILNPYNLAIGSGLTVYLDVGVNAFYPITKNLNLGVGYSLTHFSNGGFERPNRGLNLSSPSVELKYYFNSRPNTREIEKPPKKMERSNDLYLMLGYGDHQMVEHELDSNYFSISGIGAYYSVQMGNGFRSGVGIDLNYLMSLSAYPDGTLGARGSWDNLTVGLIVAPEMIVGRLSIITGIGIYAKHSKYGDFKQTYQRAGMKFHLTENISAGMNVRAVNFMLAEFLEFNVGYRFKWER